MTTYTLSGFTLYYDNEVDADTGLKPSTTLQLVVPDSTTSLSYSFLPLQPGDTAPDDVYVEIALNEYNVRIDGQALPESDEPDASIFQLTWNDGLVQRVSTILIVEELDANVPPFGTVDSQNIFLLGGDPLPVFNTLAEFNTFFDNSVTDFNVPPASSPFGPGKDIPLNTVSASVTEDDLIIGDDDNNNFDGGAGNDTILGLGGDDALFGGEGDDSINPGSNDFGFDLVAAGTGNDTVDLSDVTSETAVGIQHFDLNAGVTISVDEGANTASVDKGANGTTQIINAANAINGWGLDFAGTSFDDTFNINAGNNPDGFLLVFGDAGNDTFNIAPADAHVRLDYRSSNVSNGVDINLFTGIVSDDGFGGQDTINGAENLTSLRATMLDDNVIGSAGNDQIILMAGDDTADGGDGFDVIRYDRSGVDAVNVNLQTGTATGTWRGDSFTHTLSNFEEVRGSREGDDTIVGRDTPFGDYLDGRGGNDSLDGGGGVDTLVGGEGNDTLLGGAGGDLLLGGAGDDSINPGTNDDDYDAIIAGTGNDTVDLSGVGPTTYVGLEHWDLEAGITLTVNATTNTGFVDKGAGGTTQIIDVATAINGWGLDVSGSFQDDTFNITAGDNENAFITVIGEGGDDTFNINAGAGHVRLSYSRFDVENGVDVNLSTGIVSEDGFGGQDTINGVQNLTDLRTTMLDDNVIGSDGRDRIILMAGDDTADGGDGVDLIRYDRSGVEAVTVNLETGTATGIWRGENFTHTLSNFEEIRGSRDRGDTLTGKNGQNNHIDGMGGKDTIVGGENGNDTLNGGDGLDSIIGQSGDDYITGGNGRDVLQGDAGRDTLDGGAGADTLRGGGGSDSMMGGDGMDRLFASDGFDTLDGGNGADTLGGGSGNDLILGGLGNDVAYGGAGKDFIDGGEGNDRLFAGGGDDTVYGRDGNDNLGGSNGNDRLFGEAGDDTIFGGSGNDNLLGSDGNDELWGGANNDTVFGGADNDVLRGGSGEDSLSAGSGADWLDGGTGNDTLRGGADGDTFVFSAGADQIVDFSAGDRIDLSGVDGITDFVDLQLNHLSGGAEAVISDSLGNTLTLQGVDVGSLGVTDFIFSEDLLI